VALRLGHKSGHRPTPTRDERRAPGACTTSTVVQAADVRIEATSPAVVEPVLHVSRRTPERLLLVLILS
jgi:hypothetical protein